MNKDDIDDLLGGAAGNDAPESSASDETEAYYPLYGTAAEAPAIFADGCVFAYQSANIVKLTFAESIIDPLGSDQPGAKNRIVGTLVLPKEGFAATVRYLNDQAKLFGLEV